MFRLVPQEGHAGLHSKKGTLRDGNSDSDRRLKHGRHADRNDRQRSGAITTPSLTELQCVLMGWVKQACGGIGLS